MNSVSGGRKVYEKRRSPLLASRWSLDFTYRHALSLTR